MDSLPPEVLEKVLKPLSFGDIVNFSRLNHYLNNVFRKLQKSLAKNHFEKATITECLDVSLSWFSILCLFSAEETNVFGPLLYHLSIDFGKSFLITKIGIMEIATVTGKQSIEKSCKNIL